MEGGIEEPLEGTFVPLNLNSTLELANEPLMEQRDVPLNSHFIKQGTDMIKAIP